MGRLARCAICAIALAAAVTLGACAAPGQPEQREDSLEVGDDVSRPSDSGDVAQGPGAEPGGRAGDGAARAENASEAQRPAVPEAQEAGASETSHEGEAEPSMAATTMAANGKTFDVQLADNETARAFAALLPAELSMDELNGNEKYCYFDAPLPSSAEAVRRIEAGDIMLYGDRCIVVFYESHDTSYSYTRIGTVENPEGLAEAAGPGTANIRFE